MKTTPERKMTQQKKTTPEMNMTLKIMILKLDRWHMASIIGGTG